MEYRNLDLWVERGESGRYLIQGKSDQGDFRDFAQVDLAALPIDQEALATARADLPTIEALGSALYTFLFKTAENAKLESLLDRSLGAVTRDRWLRLRLQLDEANPEIAALPWEYLYSPVDGSFLATSIRTPIVRFLEIGIPLRDMEARLPLRMLVVIPAVEGLDVAHERDLIEEALEGMGEGVELTVLDGIVTTERLRLTLAETDFDLLHFIGHGEFRNDRATLRFNDAAGDAAWLDHETIAELIRNQPGLRLVTLNSCQGATLSATTAFVGMAPRLVAMGVPAVVAMQYPVRDDEALCFARAFYSALFRGRGRGSVDFAISTARSALKVEFPRSRALGVPALFMRYEEGVLFRVVRGNLIRDLPYGADEADRERAVIREGVASRRRREAAGPGPPDRETGQQVEAEERTLARAERRLQLRNLALRTAIAAVLLVGFALHIRLFDPLTPYSPLATLPIWFGDPAGHALSLDSVAIVTTQDSITGAWRPRHAEVITRLAEAGARVVVLDLFFVTPRPEDDAVLADAIRSARDRGTRVVFGAVDVRDGQPVAVAALAEGADIGSACLGENPGLFSGVVPLFWESADGETLVPSMALAAVAAARGQEWSADIPARQVTLRDAQSRVTDRIQLAGVETVRDSQPACAMMRRGSRYGEMLAPRAPVARWRDPVRRFDHAAVRTAAPSALEWARDRIVLVGEARGRELTRRRIGFRVDERYGVERHADAVATLLNGAEVRRLGALAHLVAIALAAGYGAWIAFHGRVGLRARRWAWLAGGLAAFGLLAAVAYRVDRLLVDVMYPIAAMLVVAVVVTFLRRRLAL